jgi:hypothetical protein
MALTKQDIYVQETLHLQVSNKCFEMVRTGEQDEVYLRLTDYWCKVLDFGLTCKYFHKSAIELSCCKRKTFDPSNPYGHCCVSKSVTSQVVYTKMFQYVVLHSKGFDFTCSFRIKSITIGEGKKIYGAKKGEEYFIISLGAELAHLPIKIEKNLRLWSEKEGTVLERMKRNH